MATVRVHKLSRDEHRRRIKRRDKLFGARATTRNWNTIIAIVQILKGGDNKAKRV